MLGSFCRRVTRAVCIAAGGGCGGPIGTLVALCNTSITDVSTTRCELPGLLDRAPNGTGGIGFGTGPTMLAGKGGVVYLIEPVQWAQEAPFWALFYLQDSMIQEEVGPY